MITVGRRKQAVGSRHRMSTGLVQAKKQNYIRKLTVTPRRVEAP